MKIIEKHNQDDSGTSKDIGRKNIDIKDSWPFYFLILLLLATQLPDWIPYLKHKLMLMDIKSSAEIGNKSVGKKNVAYLLNNSKNKNVIAEAMYLQALYRLTANDIVAFGKLKAYYPNSKYISRLEVVFERAKGLRKELTGELKKLDQDFVYIQPGTFTMGSPSNEPGRKDNEKQHSVTLTKGFSMQTKEATQGQWKAVMGNNPSYFKNCGDDCPVEGVSWDDVQEFINKLNLRFGHGVTYRLPTEAEWEYAARAGSKTAFANGDISETGCGYDANLDAMGWYCGNSGVSYNGCKDESRWGGPKCRGPHPVAQKQPNAWGLYDMHGNVGEWCQDWFDENYPSGAVTDPTGSTNPRTFANEPRYRVRRGGDWHRYAMGCRSANRGRSGTMGFRLLRNP